jgi:hypothetical protein
MNSEISRQKLDHSIAGYYCRAGDYTNFLVVRNGCIDRDYYYSDEALHSQAMMEAIRQGSDSLVDRDEAWTTVFADPRLNGYAFTVTDTTDKHYLRPTRDGEVERTAELTTKMLLHSGQRSALMSRSNGVRDDRLFSRLVARVVPLMDLQLAKHRIRAADYAGEVRGWSSTLQVEYEDGSKPTVVFPMKEHGSRAEALKSVEREMKPRFSGLCVEEHKLKFGNRPEHEMEISYAPA